MVSTEPMVAKQTKGAAVRNIFWGKAGLRAGWGILLFLVFIGLILVPLSFGLRAITGHPPKSTGVPVQGAILGEGIAVIAVLGATWLMSLIEKRKVTDYYLKDVARWRKLGLGALAGVLAMSVLVGALAVGHFLVFDRVLLSGPSVAGFALAWALAFLEVALFEELMFRGYLQFTLARGINFWAAVGISSLLFGAVHLGNGGENVVGITSVLLAGLLLAISIKLTGSLYWAIGFHAAWDWAQSYLFGVADSGMVSAGRLIATHPVGNELMSGAKAGPEGSLLVIPVVFGVIGLLCWSKARNAPDFTKLAA